MKLTGSTKNKKTKDFKYLFTNQNSKPLSAEDIINITLVLIKVQKMYTQFNRNIEYL